MYVYRTYGGPFATPGAAGQRVDAALYLPRNVARCGTS